MSAPVCGINPNVEYGGFIKEEYRDEAAISNAVHSRLWVQAIIISDE